MWITQKVFLAVLQGFISSKGSFSLPQVSMKCFVEAKPKHVTAQGSHSLLSLFFPSLAQDKTSIRIYVSISWCCFFAGVAVLKCVPTWILQRLSGSLSQNWMSWMFAFMRLIQTKVDLRMGGVNICFLCDTCTDGRLSSQSEMKMSSPCSNCVSFILLAHDQWSFVTVCKPSDSLCWRLF